MLSEYLDLLDVRRLPKPVGLQIAETVVPHLLGKIAESGCTVQAEEGSEALESFHAARIDGTLYPLLARDLWAADRGDACSVFLVEEGQIIGCIGCSVLWIETTLAAYLESLPDKLGSPAIALDAIERVHSCHVCFVGGGYIAKEKRGKRVYREMYDLAMILALTRWRWSWAFTLFRKDNPLNATWNPLSLALETCRFESLQPHVDVRGKRTYLATMRREAAWRHFLDAGN